jgi:hypothetical protein
MIRRLIILLLIVGCVFGDTTNLEVYQKLTDIVHKIEKNTSDWIYHKWGNYKLVHILIQVDTYPGNVGDTALPPQTGPVLELVL